MAGRIIRRVQSAVHVYIICMHSQPPSGTHRLGASSVTYIGAVDGKLTHPIQGLTSEETGHALSHMYLWLSLASSNSPALILEDPAALDDSCPARMQEILAQPGHEDVDIVFMGSSLSDGYLVSAGGVKKLATWALSGSLRQPLDAEIAAMVKTSSLINAEMPAEPASAAAQ